jgi:hypothetical protein
VLVVVPLTKRIPYMFGFSAPLAWLLAGRGASARGIFGHELEPSLVRQADVVVVELNWFTQLYEFSLLVAQIKQFNPRCLILFGGLYAQLQYREVFARWPVDLFIKGDNELPLRLLLDGEELGSIPNLVTRDHEAPLEYRITPPELLALELDLSWFPSYRAHVARYPTADNTMFCLPMIITSRGGCAAVHGGCDYCLGAQREVLGAAYGRPPITMDEATLRHLLRQAAPFGQFSLYVLSPCVYDLSDLAIDADVSIEIDSAVEPDQLRRLISGFARCRVLIPLYREGIMGQRPVAAARDLLAVGDPRHEIRFAAYGPQDDAVRQLPPESVAYVLDTFDPPWAQYSFYSQFDRALGFARENFRLVTQHLRELGMRRANPLYAVSCGPRPRMSPVPPRLRRGGT